MERQDPELLTAYFKKRIQAIIEDNLEGPKGTTAEEKYKETSLEKVPVPLQRLMAHIKDQVCRILYEHAREPNDNSTRLRVRESISGFLKDICDRKGLHQYKIVCDETNNPPHVVDNELYAIVYFQPRDWATEFSIPFRIRLTRTQEQGDYFYCKYVPITKVVVVESHEKAYERAMSTLK